MNVFQGMEFKELAHAYEVLSNPEKREIYGQYGEDDLKKGMGEEEPLMIHLTYSKLSLVEVLAEVSVVLVVRGEEDKNAVRMLFFIGVSLEDLYNGTTKISHCRVSCAQNVKG
ncbi:hypothetical protein CRG98_024559 [Punica granatum]|uniref:J domain-containing protein n=1 Tax=Punica granatum TaxID=22663 RepID=A0A2I0JFK9_PUNGR|nr:hypothetical protein CRG98_024559 [Punica granatum]